MVLDDVAHRAGFLVERAAGADAVVLGYRDLYVVHVVLVPDRLEDTVREPQRQDILDRLFAEIVVYPVDLLFPKLLLDILVQLLGALQVSAEGLLDHQPRVTAVLTLVHAGVAELLHDGRK